MIVADQGRAIPFAMREQIKALRIGRVSVRETARIVGVNKDTVTQWGPKNLRGTSVQNY